MLLASRAPSYNREQASSDPQAVPAEGTSCPAGLAQRCLWPEQLIPRAVAPQQLRWNSRRVLCISSPDGANQALDSHNHPSHFSAGLIQSES